MPFVETGCGERGVEATPWAFADSRGLRQVAPLKQHHLRRLGQHRVPKLLGVTVCIANVKGVYPSAAIAAGRNVIEVANDLVALIRLKVLVGYFAVARFGAGILAALWAMAALANEYATVASVGISTALVIAICTNVFLIAGASLAFIGANGWRTVLLIALSCVTVDRLVNAAASAAPLQIVSALIAFGAIAGVSLIGIRRRRF